MWIYTFKSETKQGLRAFAGDYEGSKLPVRFGPWSVTGKTRPGVALPHKISRPAIERAIQAAGFQLWRLKPEPDAVAAGPKPAAPANPPSPAARRLRKTAAR